MEPTRYVVRAKGSGVWAGEISERNSETSVTMKNARRLWYWSGASSLSEVAQSGVQNPSNCKFPVKVDEVYVTNVLEIIKMTEDAWENIERVEVWTQN